MLICFTSWGPELALSHAPSDLYRIQLVELWLSRASGLIAQLIGLEQRARPGWMSWHIFHLSPLALSGSKESLITDTRRVRLATALFPVVSLLNHSCSPNTSVSFIGTIATIRASQLIRSGQEILHCYGEPSIPPAAHPSPAGKDGVNSHGQATKQVSSPAQGGLFPGGGGTELLTRPCCVYTTVCLMAWSL